jgi:phosphatidylglycerophosphate synthase
MIALDLEPVSWEEFQRKAVPEYIRIRESKKNAFVPVSRWVAIREAYVLHHLGITGNMVSLFRIVLVVISLYLFSRFAAGELLIAFAGVVLMAWQLNLDSVDGALARVQDRASDFGDALDNLGIDYARASFWILIAAMSQNLLLVISSILVAYLLVPFRQYQVAISRDKIDRFVANFMYVPVLWVIVPSIMLMASVLGLPPVLMCRTVSWFYIFLAGMWFLSCLWRNLVTDPSKKSTAEEGRIAFPTAGTEVGDQSESQG